VREVSIIVAARAGGDLTAIKDAMTGGPGARTHRSSWIDVRYAMPR
jgi:hypothetical protein